MYAYQIFEKFKADEQNELKNKGNRRLYESGNMLFIDLIDKEGYDKKNAFNLAIGIFGCVTCNDGKVSIAEYEAFLKMLNLPKEKISYDHFFDAMAKSNKQENRNITVQSFKSFKDSDTAYWFITLAIDVALVDGEVSDREETFITSLCGVYRDRFLRR